MKLYARWFSYQTTSGREEKARVPKLHQNSGSETVSKNVSLNPKSLNTLTVNNLTQRHIKILIEENSDL